MGGAAAAAAPRLPAPPAPRDRPPGPWRKACRVCPAQPLPGAQRGGGRWRRRLRRRCSRARGPPCLCSALGNTHWHQQTPTGTIRHAPARVDTHCSGCHLARGRSLWHQQTFGGVAPHSVSTGSRRPLPQEGTNSLLGRLGRQRRHPPHGRPPRGVPAHCRRPPDGLPPLFFPGTRPPPLRGFHIIQSICLLFRPAHPTGAPVLKVGRGGPAQSHAAPRPSLWV